MAGDGLLAAFTSWPIPIAGVLAYHLPGIGSHSKSKVSPTEELARRAVQSQAPEKNSKMLWPVSSMSKSLVGNRLNFQINLELC